MKVKNNFKTISIGIAIIAFIPLVASAVEPDLHSGYYTTNSGYYNADYYGPYKGSYSEGPYGYDESSYYGDIYGGGVGLGDYSLRGWRDARSWEDRGYGRRGGDALYHDGSSHRLYHSGGYHGGGGRGRR